MKVMKRNYTVDLIRLVMAVLIVAMHSNPFWEINQYLSYFLTQTISRVAVPFFAFVAGIFFFGNPSEKRYTKSFRRYLISYSIWSGIYFLYLSVVRALKGNLLTIPFVLKTFFLTGFYHLWYLLACIYTILLLWILSRKETHILLFKSRFLFLGLGILTFGYRNIFGFINPFFSWVGLSKPDTNFITNWLFLFFPFFLCGYGFYEKPKNKFLYEKCEKLLPVCIVLLVLEIAIGKLAGYLGSTILVFMTFPSVYMIIIFAVKHPLIGNETSAKFSAGISSFMYFGHVLFVLMMQEFGISETPTFFITLFITASLGALVIRSKNTLLKKLI